MKLASSALVRARFYAGIFTLLLCFAVVPDARAERAILPIFDETEIGVLCEQSLEDFRQRVSELEKIPAQTQAGSADFMRKWNQLQIAIEDVHAPLYLLSQVSPVDNVRTNAKACDAKLRVFGTDLYQNEKLYRNVRVCRTADNVERKWRSETLYNFEDAGIGLMPKKQKRMREIRVRLTALQQEFSRNIRENKARVEFSPEQMAGLPDDFLAAVPRDRKGNYLLDFSYPVYVPFMRLAKNREARRQYQLAFINRGTPKNLELLQEVVNLRHEMAVLSGYRSYADFVLRRRMAKKVATVEKFLDQVQQATDVAEKRELEAIQSFMETSSDVASSASGQTIERWDIPYWQEQLRKERFNVDQNALRRYFPTDAAIGWVMGLSQDLFNITFTKADVPLWHEDVTYFDVHDNETNEQLGGVYLDLFPRENKYGHAAAFGVRGSSRLEGRKPVTVLVTNFNKNGLDANELETLLHEFGHLLHGVLSQSRFVELSGTRVERDFVEVPSQIFEEWGRREESLSLLPKYCTSPCPAVDEDLLRRINQARKFGKGIFYARQSLFARYDMALYDELDRDVKALWEDMEGRTRLGHTKGTQFPGQFNHVISGYAAGYYSYLWSEMLVMDLLSQFGSNLMNPQVALRYRKTILERGGEAGAEELFRAFSGRSPDNRAFFNSMLEQSLE